MSGYAKVRVYTSEGVLSQELIMRSLLLKIRRAERGQKPELDSLYVSADFAGVSRQHAEISWSDKDVAFRLVVTGRNGAIVNKKKIEAGSSAILSPRTLSAFALGKHCLIYFAPATIKRPQTSPKPSIIQSEENINSASKRPPPLGSWQAAICAVFELKGVSTLPVTTVIEQLQNDHQDYFAQVENNGWKKYVRSVLRKSPFQAEDGGNNVIWLRESPSVVTGSPVPETSKMEL